MRKLFAILLLVIIMTPLFWGCAFTDTVSSIFNPKSSSEQSVDESLMNPASDIYVDSKTGAIITKKQYNVYRFVDGYKKYGGYVAIACFAIGLFLRLFVRGSMVIKKLSLFLFIAIPIIYIILAYVFSYFGDKA